MSNKTENDNVDTSTREFSTDQLRTFQEKVTDDPQLYRTFFENATDPAFIMDVQTGHFLDMNEAFLSLTGYNRDQLVGGSVSAEDIIVPENRQLLKNARKNPSDIQEDRYEVRGMDREGNTIPIELSIASISYEDRTFIFGIARDLTEQKEKEMDLREQLNEAMRSNNRILALTEKIKNVPVLTSTLLNLDREEEFYQKTREFLCERTGMDYARVIFYRFNEAENKLEPAHSPDEDDGETIEMNSNHPAVRVATGETDMVRSDEDEFILPLRGTDEIYGVMKVTLNRKERELMEGNLSAWDGYQETLVTLSNLLGLILQNRRLFQKVHQQSIRDELTGIYNRRHFNRKLKEEVNRSRRYHHPLSLLIIDVDEFKEINDSYGHQQGDRMLQTIAETFKENCRKSDVVCRYGGDEFGLILPETDSENAERKAQRILETFEDRTFTVKTEEGETKDIQISVSIGMSYLPEEGNTDVQDDLLQNFGDDELLRAADQCMYKAKTSDEKQFVKYDGPTE